MVAAFGMDVAVGRVRGADAEGMVGSACVSPGLAMYMGAQLEGVGVAGAAQLDKNRANRSKVEQRCV